MLAQSLQADLGYGFKVPDHPYFSDDLFKGKEFPLLSFTAIPIWRQYCLARAFRRKTDFLASYDAVVYSGSYAPLASCNSKKGRNIYYCHTPPRFLYDQHDFFLSLIPGWQRPILHAFNSYFRPRYEEAVAGMDVVVTNSDNVRGRIKKYLGLDAEVVYPPCDTGKFKWHGQHDFYLSMARLDPLKRVDRVVEAFRQMTDKRLVVVSGGPEQGRLEKLAGGAANIEIRGRVSEKELLALLGRCLATIYIPRDEDFGMAPVESMAAGKPVIAVAEGGLLESVVDGQTGLLLHADPGTPEIIAAVEHLTGETAGAMRSACEERAHMFRRELFVKRMREMCAAV